MDKDEGAKRLLDLSILTPYSAFFNGGVESLVITLGNGEICVLTGHAPFVGTTLVGIMRIRQAGQVRLASVTSGSLIVTPKQATLLVAAAEWKDEIDIARAKASLERAERRLEESSVQWIASRAKNARQRALNRIRLYESGA